MVRSPRGGAPATCAGGGVAGVLLLVGVAAALGAAMVRRPPPGPGGRRPRGPGRRDRRAPAADACGRPPRGRRQRRRRSCLRRPGRRDGRVRVAGPRWWGSRVRTSTPRPVRGPAERADPVRVGRTPGRATSAVVRVDVLGARPRRAPPSSVSSLRSRRREARLVPNLRIENPQRTAAPDATPTRKSATASTSRPSSSPCPAGEDRRQDPERADEQQEETEDHHAPQPSARGAQEERRAGDRAGLVEGVVLVAALGRLDARRAALAQPQASMASRVAVSHARAARKPALGEAGAAGVAVVDEHGEQAGVGGAAPSRPRRCPSGRRSRRAAAGRSSSARRRARRPGRSAAARPASASTWSGTVHHTAVVRRARSGRSSGSSPSTSPPGWRRLRNETTWWETSTSPNDRRHPPQSACSRSATIVMSVTSRAVVE